MGMGVIKLTDENFENEVIKSPKTVVVDFYADWCGPCKMMSPIIDKIAEDLGNTVKVGKVNTDECMNLALQYEIMSIPTIIIYKNGEVSKIFNGVTDKSEIMDALK